MWIKSQNKNALINPKNVKAFHISFSIWNIKQCNVCADDYVLGTFNDTDSAQQVLDNIMNTALDDSNNIYVIQ